MCSLFGSPDRNTFVELAKLNEYRGAHSHSIATFDYKDVTVCSKQLGSFVMSDDVRGSYYLGHAQAPTTDAKSIDAVHPSAIDGTYLWHNGIIKDHQVKKWQHELGLQEPWDTKLLHQLLTRNDFKEVLSSADGSFACVWWNGTSLYLFHNANCPLFTDGVSYSSTAFNGSYPLTTDTIYELTRDGIRPTDMTFETKTNFYWSFE
jgi:glutamine phosphoribosylpyrophosphate amidotransferase